MTNIVKNSDKDKYVYSHFGIAFDGKGSWGFNDDFDSKEVSFKENAYEFSVDYDAIDKSNILNIHQYLMIKNSIKNVWNY